jgi:nucleoside-diphosphate-sugar epimerase
MTCKNVAVLGATGFLGQQILINLVDNGYKVTVILQNTNDNLILPQVEIVTLKQFLSCKVKFDFIINCAGYYSKSDTISEIYKIRKSNYILIKKLIKFRKKKGGSFITFGSYFEQKPLWRNISASHYTKYKIKAKKLLNSSAKKISFPTFYIYLFDTYGEEDNRNKVLNYIINEFKVGKIPKLDKPLEYINWSHKSDISASIVDLVKNSDKYLSYELHEFQIRSPDEFRLVDFVDTISKILNLYETGFHENSISYNLLDCAPNLKYFKARNNVLNFTLKSIQKNYT